MVAETIMLLTLLAPVKSIKAANNNDVISILGADRHKKKVAPKKQETQKKSNKPRVSFKKKWALSKAENEALKERLQNLQSSRLKLDFTTSLNIPAGTTIKGVLLNSVVSTNLTSPLLVEVKPNKYITQKARLLCTGKRENRRVYVACDRLVTQHREYQGLTTSLLNLDGSNGLKGDYWSGEERYVAGVMTTSLASGVILASQDTTPTGFGQQVTNSGKNTVINGVASSVDAATRLITEKLKKSQGVVTLKAGEEVLVYFNGGYTR